MAAGRLALALDRWEPQPSAIHAVYSSARWLPAKVRPFIDLAVETTAWRFLDARPAEPGSNGLRDPVP